MITGKKCYHFFHYPFYFHRGVRKFIFKLRTGNEYNR